jgi:hypothetical protein
LNGFLLDTGVALVAMNAPEDPTLITFDRVIPHYASGSIRCDPFPFIS